MMVLLYCPIFIKMITFAKHFILIISFNLHNNTVTKIRKQLVQEMLTLLVQGTHFENQCLREYSLCFLVFRLVSELLDPFHMAVEAHVPGHLSVLDRGRVLSQSKTARQNAGHPTWFCFFLPDKRY